MSAVEVSVERDGRSWLVRVPELRRTSTARNLSEVEQVARDLVALLRDVGQAMGVSYQRASQLLSNWQ